MIGIRREDFEPIHRVVTTERDMEKASRMVDERMLRIGVVGTPNELIDRLQPLADAGRSIARDRAQSIDDASIPTIAGLESRSDC